MDQITCRLHHRGGTGGKGKVTVNPGMITTRGPWVNIHILHMEDKAKLPSLHLQLTLKIKDMVSNSSRLISMVSP